MNKRKTFIIGSIIGFIAIGFLTMFFFDVIAPSQYTVLFVGSDQRGTERARSDVMFIVTIPKKADAEPFFLSIPRDTKVEHEEWGLQKMTHFYVLGDRPDDGKLLGNIDLTRTAVEDLLDIKIDATIEVTFESFAEIVDVIGGASVSSRASTGQKFDGVDTAALTSGALSGEEALVVIRDRFTGGRSDFDRQADAREILRSLITQVKDPAVIKEVLAYFKDSDQARLDFKQTKLIRFLIGAGVSRKGKVSIGEMSEDTIPGQGGRIYTPDFGKELYYWIPDEEALQELVQEHF